MEDKNPDPALIGKLIANLIGLETILRIYLIKKEKQEKKFITPEKLEVGMQVEINNFTNYLQLSSLIERFNSFQSEEFKINKEEIINIRDLFAHGRALSTNEDLPPILVKFSKELNTNPGFVTVTNKEIFDNNYLKNSTNLIYEAIKLVKERIENEFSF